MKFTRIAALVVGAFVALSGVGFAATVSQSGSVKASTKKVAAAPTMAVHATSGVVKSIDDDKLVISKSANKGPETTFTLNSSTTKDSSIAPGSTVDVRYHNDGTMKVATAVSVHQAKTAKR